jgi:hypothetical protein
MGSTLDGQDISEHSEIVPGVESGSFEPEDHQIYPGIEPRTLEDALQSVAILGEDHV